MELILFPTTMAAEQDTLPYQPRVPWVPLTQEGQFPSTSLHELVETYTRGDPDTQLEEQIVHELAVTSHIFIPRNYPGSAIYRAADAVLSGVGDCRAHTDATVAAGESLDLEMGISWSGAHATALWLGKAATWIIDGYHKKGGLLLKSHPRGQQARDAVREAFAENEGVYVLTDLWDEETKDDHKVMQTVRALAPLSEQTNPFYNIDGMAFLILPAEQGLSCLGALGDLRALKDGWLEHNYAGKEDQIRTFLPAHNA